MRQVQNKLVLKLKMIFYLTIFNTQKASGARFYRNPFYSPRQSHHDSFKKGVQVILRITSSLSYREILSLVVMFILFYPYLDCIAPTRKFNSFSVCHEEFLDNLISVWHNREDGNKEIKSFS